MSDITASSLFSEFAARVERGERPDFEALVRACPARAAELNRLHAAWKASARAPHEGEKDSRGERARSSSDAQPDGAPGSLAQRLRQRFGDDVEPHVSLQGGDERASSFSDEVIARLADRKGSFGRYQLKGEIARGGMGAILKIWDEDLHRHLAMKVILGQVAAPVQDESSARPRQSQAAPTHQHAATPPVESSKIARFLEEAQVTGQLDHPGIVPVHELGLDPEGRVYFTMKLVKGQSLKEVFDLVAERKEGWSQTKALGVLLKVCEAMAYAHDKGVIHRDLKPGNVMVGKFGEVHVMDWGLARILGRQDERDIRIRDEVTALSTDLRSERDDHRGETPESPLYTMDGDVVGTPAYMPPEQAAGKVSEMGPHSDVYAMGAMLYHLLAGHMPYVPKAARLNNYAIWGLVQQGPPTSIVKLAPETPAELVAICEKAMAREWRDRYRDMSALAADLAAYLEHRVVGAYETGAWAETKKWVERNKPLAASLAAGVLALVAGLVVSMGLTKKNRELFVLAEDGRTRAEANEKTAKLEKSNVLRLSAFQTLDDLTSEADALWPAEPSMLERYRAWIDKAEKLVAKIPEFRESLVEIEARAQPQTDAERQAERQSHPRLAELEQKTAQRLWLSRMFGESTWPSESSVEAELSKESVPADANALNGLAWTLVDPEKPVYGSEVKALLLARRAVALSNDTDRAANRDTLSWALYRLGRFDEALAEERRALEEVEAAKKKEYEGYVAKLEAAVKRWQGDGRAERVKEREAAAHDVATLEADVSKRRDWRFAEEDDRWWHAQMEKLVVALTAFTDEHSGLMRGISAERGWGIARRLDFAASIEERSVSGADAVDRWSKAIQAISRSEKYRGVKWSSGERLTPQLGLLPIGADPDSGLWEFTHLQTGEPAQRGADGKLILTEEVGLVLVLIPGGTFTMGAQRTDPTGSNYDPQATSDESPVHEVTLSPYFLSKYEMTQGQWLRFTGRNPSQYSQSNFSTSWNRAGKGWAALHPVEQVSWFDCVEMLGRLGLVLPTEAQWENGARAGTTTVYWSGDEAVALQEAGNVSDAYAKGHGGAGWSVIHEAWDDGETVHAEVGTYRANAFGLHDVHGNVWEWCRDGWNSYSAVKQLDPLTPWSGARYRVYRGGGFSNAASDARSASRSSNAPEYRLINLGVRPARASLLAPSLLHPPGK